MNPLSELFVKNGSYLFLDFIPTLNWGRWSHFQGGLLMWLAVGRRP